MIESVHSGSAVVTARDGSVLASWGEPSAMVYPRSAAKPLQLLAMMRSGLDLPADLLTLVTASHSGQADHVRRVRDILDRFGIAPSALANAPDWPLDESLRQRALAAGDPATSLAQNCSGKHAGMLATCAVNSWPLAGYLDPDHPLQVRIASTIDELTSRSTADGLSRGGVDGCGAPTPAFSLVALSQAFGVLAGATDGVPEHRISTAIRTHSFLLGGDGRPITRFLDAVPGLMAKDGADAVWAAALPDGRALAVKIGDGGERAVPAVVVRLLAELDIRSPALDAFADRPVLGGGKPVGNVVPAF